MSGQHELILKKSSGLSLDEDYDVMWDGEVVGRIFNDASTHGRPWFWNLAYGHHRDRYPTYGQEPTCEAAMAAFRKSWDRQ
jgi:hypothetical protein